MRKLEKIKPFGHSKAPKKKKIGQILLIFPVLGKTTHMPSSWDSPEWPDSPESPDSPELPQSPDSPESPESSM